MINVKTHSILEKANHCVALNNYVKLPDYNYDILRTQ